MGIDNMNVKHWPSHAVAMGALVLAFGGCKSDREDDNGSTGVLDGGLEAGDSGIGDDGADSGGDRLDTEQDEGGINPCAEGGDCPDDCEEQVHEPCDETTSDPFEAMGLNCPDTHPVTGTVAGSPMAIGLLDHFGDTDEWDPTEGHQMAVIGSGLVADLHNETPPGDDDVGPLECNDDLDTDIFNPMYDPGATLPAPLVPVDVGGDCAANPTLIGTGDCSNSIQGQFDQGVNANDYTELRVVATVPESNNSFSYDLAFFSTEYPFYYESQFNDMYVGWLESQSWTGNVSFDEIGNPISLNAGFLDFKDDGAVLPEFDGTCMKQHAGTKWLTTTAPVTPGESVTIVFAIFDLSDSILDSYVLLDNFIWGCDGTDRPETKPQG